MQMILIIHHHLLWGRGRKKISGNVIQEVQICVENDVKISVCAGMLYVYSLLLYIYYKGYASSRAYIYSISNMFLQYIYIYICMEGPPTSYDVPFNIYFFLTALLASLVPMFFTA